jgi:hypothetical protein
MVLTSVKLCHRHFHSRRHNSKLSSLVPLRLPVSTAQVWLGNQMSSDSNNERSSTKKLVFIDRIPPKNTRRLQTLYARNTATIHKIVPSNSIAFFKLLI